MAARTLRWFAALLAVLGVVFLAVGISGEVDTSRRYADYLPPGNGWWQQLQDRAWAIGLGALILAAVALLARSLFSGTGVLPNTARRLGVAAAGILLAGGLLAFLGVTAQSRTGVGPVTFGWTSYEVSDSSLLTRVDPVGTHASEPGWMGRHGLDLGLLLLGLGILVLIGMLAVATAAVEPARADDAEPRD